MTARPSAPDNCHPAQNWKLTLAYDGSDFSGWQVQPGLRTVQGELAAAIERICGEKLLPQGSGRTDAGVHALGQVASFALASPIPQANLLRALRFTLPQDVQPLSVEAADADFHARHSARRKTYEYRVLRADTCSPFTARFVLPVSYRLDVAAMQQAASAVVGTHDFASFAAMDPDVAARTSQEEDGAPAVSTERTVYASEWLEDGGMLLYRVTGNGFLHHMVRNLVGTFLDVGRGRFAADEVTKILAARDRAAAGATAPARGLFLVNVEYGDAE